MTRASFVLTSLTKMTAASTSEGNSYVLSVYFGGCSPSERLSAYGSVTILLLSAAVTA